MHSDSLNPAKAVEKLCAHVRETLVQGTQRNRKYINSL